MANQALETHIDEMLAVCRKNKYFPTVFIRMRDNYGTVNAIERLVQNGDIQSGFERLRRLGLLDWTIEAAVLKFPGDFSASAQECAEFRLRTAQLGK